jgi:hypothetical protein
MARQSTKSLIGSSAYWTINKKMAKKIGLHATLLLQHFIDLEDAFFDGEFYQQFDRLSEDLFLSKKQISSLLKILENENFISISRRGIPRKNFYTINHNVILEFLSGSAGNRLNSQKGTAKTKHLETNNCGILQEDTDEHAPLRFDIAHI